MKTWKIVVLFLLASQPAWAYHNFFFRDAGDLTTGILPNERLDPSSVTLQGNAVNFATVYKSLKDEANTWSAPNQFLSTFTIFNNGLYVSSSIHMIRGIPQDRGFTIDNPNGNFEFRITLPGNASDGLFIRMNNTTMGQWRLDTNWAIGTAGHAAAKLFVTGNERIDSGYLSIKNATQAIIIGDSDPATKPSSAIDLVGVSSLSITGTGGIRVKALAGLSSIGADAEGNFIAGSAGGGAVGNSTMTKTLFSSGGPVFLATSSFMAVDGLAGKFTSNTTLYIESLQAFTGYGSSVAVTKFQIVKTTSVTSPPSAWLNWGPQIHTSTSTTAGIASSWGVLISTRLQLYPTEMYALHIDSVPVSGDQSRGFGIIANVWEQPLP